MRTKAELFRVMGRRLVEDVDDYLEACQGYASELSTDDRTTAAAVWQHLRERVDAGSQALAAVGS